MSGFALLFNISENLLNCKRCTQAHFVQKDGFYWKTKSLCDVLKVLHLAKFSEIWGRYITQDKVSDHKHKITFQLSDFVCKALFIGDKKCHVKV